jgi:pimeloyl-ACP methyl ester carboxylesterase
MTYPSRPSLVVRVLKRIGVGLLILVVVLLVGGTGYEWLARQRAHRDFPAQGALVDIGGRRMHLDCRGTGEPTVVFESGLDTGGSLAWEHVHEPVSRLTRACVYDRAGVMWSDPKPQIQDANGVADDLHALLRAAHIDGPLVLVAHSLGGPYVMTYTRKFGDEVKGLVFVDTSHPDQVKRLTSPKLAAAMKGSWVQDLAVKLSWTGIMRALTATQSDPPIPGMSERVRKIGKAYFSETVAGTFKEQQSITSTFSQGGQLRDLGDRPLVVLTAMEPMPEAVRKQIDFSEQDAAEMQQQWKALQDEEAGWSTRSRHELVMDSGHYVQEARPDLVIKAITEVLADVRADAAAHPGEASR